MVKMMVFHLFLRFSGDMNFTNPVNYKIKSLPRKNAPRADETKMAVHPFLVKFVFT